MADAKRVRGPTSEETVQEEYQGRLKKASRTVSESVDSKAKHAKGKEIKLKLMEIHDGVRFNLYESFFPGNQGKILEIGDQFETLEGFKEEDRYVSAAKKKSLAALKTAATKHVEDVDDWREWIKAYENAWNNRTTIAQKTKQLALRLALTNPANFFISSEWVQGNLVPCEITSAWLAAQQICGSLWMADYTESVFSFEDKVEQVAGDTLLSVAHSTERGFVEEDFEVTAVNNPHVMERRIREKLLSPMNPLEIAKGNWKDQMSVKKWHVIFRQMAEGDIADGTECWDDIASFALRLVKTDPNEFTGLWLNGHVVSCPLTYAWRAAIDVFGEAFSEVATKKVEELLENEAEEDRKTQERADAMQQDSDESENHKEDSMEIDGKTEGEGNQDSQDSEEKADEKIGFFIDRTSAKEKNEEDEEYNANDSVNLNPSKEAPKSSIREGRFGVSFLNKVEVKILEGDVSQRFNPDSSNKSVSSSISQQIYEHRRKASKRFYISKELKQEGKKDAVLQNPAFVRKHTSYLKAILPAFQYGIAHKDSPEEISEKWQNLTDGLFQIDDKLVIYPWSNDKVEPFHKRSNALRSKDAVTRYVDRLFIREGEVAWIRLKVGHNCAREEMTSEEAKRVFSASGIKCYPDSIQCQRSSCAGWFLGSHQHVNCDDLVMALKQNKHLANIEFEIRFQEIRISPDRSHRVDPKHQVKACHLYADINYVAKVKKILKKIYGRRKKVGCPLGKIFQFVPFTADSSIPISLQTLDLAKKCFRHQKKFLSALQTSTTNDIIGLDYIPESIGISLREAVMSICHPTDSKKSLFVSVDDTWQGTTFVFKSDEKVAELARSIVPVLSVIMEGRFGPAAWNWFAATAKTKTHGFKWDPKKRIVFSVEDQSMADSVYDTYLKDENSEGSEESMDEEEFAEIYGFDFQTFQPTPINFMRRMALAQQINDGEESLASFESGICGSAVLSSDSESSMEEDGYEKMAIEGHDETTRQQSPSRASDNEEEKQRTVVTVETPTHDVQQIHTEGRTPRTADSSLTEPSFSNKYTPEALEQLIRDNLESFQMIMKQKNKRFTRKLPLTMRAVVAEQNESDKEGRIQRSWGDTANQAYETSGLEEEGK